MSKSGNKGNESTDFRFSPDSFTEEITNQAEAHNAYRYLSQNIIGFKHEMQSAGFTYEQVTESVNQIWNNLIASSKRVGYSNDHLIEIERSMNSELPK